MCAADPGNRGASSGIKMNMRYWGVLFGKVLIAGAALYALWLGLLQLYTPSIEVTHLGQQPFTHDLGFTTMMFAYNLVCNAVLFFIIRDQKYRCRTCARRLRMPVRSGSHAQILFRPPTMEYICVYGHGTLNVHEVQFTGKNPPNWKQNDEDIWKELFAYKSDDR